MNDRKHMVALGLGGNVGERGHYLRDAVHALERMIQDMRASRIYESPAMLPEDAPQEWDQPFLNMAIAGITSLAPQELLMETRQLEEDLGRQRRGRWGPREIDIDILLYDGLTIEEERLTLPHPGLAERDFVLLPLAELLPDWRFPVPGPNYGMSVAAMAARMQPRATARALDRMMA